MLPSPEKAIQRNKTISSIYADLYLKHAEQFKWAGMAAFASNHVGIGLLPYKTGQVELLDLNASCKKRGLLNDLNLIRHINNRIFDDIAWTHQAYLDGGLQLMNELMEHDVHYRLMLPAWKHLDNVIHQQESDEESRRLKIWDANLELLRHEQEVVVQPMFESLGAVFKKVVTFCASLDFSPNHLKTDPKFHSSFI